MAQVYNFDAARMGMFKELCGMYNINDYFALKLRNLEGYEIVIICDDSGSMSSPVTAEGSGAYDNLKTRWDELKNTLAILISIAVVLDKNGIDVHFMNRNGLLNVTNPTQLDPIFANPPEGGTPLVETLAKVLATSCEKNRLIVIATDGEPNDVKGPHGTVINGIDEFKKLLLTGRRPNDYVVVLACTEDDAAISYLNKWDDEIPKLDVVDDYFTELKQIQKIQGKKFKFSLGDYVVKSLLGSIDPWFDSLDEKRVKIPKAHRQSKDKQCTIV